jgi:hypothetical protein
MRSKLTIFLVLVLIAVMITVGVVTHPIVPIFFMFALLPIAIVFAVGYAREQQ